MTDSDTERDNEAIRAIGKLTPEEQNKYFIPILKNKLKQLENTYDEIVEVRGAGLLLGIKTKNNNVDFSLVLRKNKLLSVTADDNVIRFAPPLIINNEEVDKAISIIDQSLKELND